MTPEQRAAMEQALEALKSYYGYMEPLLTVFGGPRVPAEQSTTAKVEKAITALTAALEQTQEKYRYGTPLLDAMTGKAQEALDKMAENAREIGLDYEPVIDKSAAIRIATALGWEPAREKVAAWMIQRGYATGHGDTIEDLLKELDWQVREAEREACEQACWDAETNDWEGRKACIDAIRARGQA